MSSQNFKISVALCTFNGGQFVGQQLESILNQSRPPDEVIICDDGSTDHTIDTVRLISNRYPSKVQLIQNEKKLGIVKNFEKAIKYAAGDIIFLSDQDDLWFKEKIATMIAPFCESDAVGLVYSDAVLTDAALCPSKHTLFSRLKHLQISNMRSARRLVRGVGVNGCTIAFRANLKNYVIPISKEWSHDHWVTFIAQSVMDIRIIDKPLMFYRRHGHNFGNGTFVEGKWLKRWRFGIKASDIAAYIKDRQHWEDMYQCLSKIASEPDFNPKNCLMFKEVLSECKQRLEFARLRVHIKNVCRFKRILPLLQALLKGKYHRYLHGMKSFLKDVLIK